MSRLLHRKSLVASALFGLAALSSAQIVHFVDPTQINGLNNGRSWADAFLTLDQALVAASAGEEIWVAATATYRPGPGTARTDTFALPSGVSVYGGFVGTEAAISLRPPGAQTRLSGDIGILNDVTDNCFHVVTIEGSSVLDGFEIFAGNADGAAPFDAGGGLSIVPSSLPTAGAVLRTVEIRNNEGLRGAGLHAADAKLEMLRCAVRENIAGLSGGGLYLERVVLRADDCEIDGNRAGFDGGGMFVTEIGTAAGRPMVQFGNGLIHHNTAQLGSGGGAYLDATGPVSGKVAFTYCTVSENVVGVRGGGIFAHTTGLRKAVSLIENSIVWANRHPSGAIDELAGRQAAFYSDCPLTTALGCFYGDPLFVGNYDLAPGSPCADSGNAAFGPEDSFDLDADGVILEPIPLDFAALTRPTGAGVSMGAYE